jgi:hypothetical protein
MAYNNAIATASIASRPEINFQGVECQDLFHPYWLDESAGAGQITGSWNWDMWMEVLLNITEAGGYKKYFSLPSGSTAADPDNYATVGDVDTWINYHATRYYFNPADSVGWYGLSGSQENAPAGGNSGSILDPDASTINEWSASYGPTDLSSHIIYSPSNDE